MFKIFIRAVIDVLATVAMIFLLLACVLFVIDKAHAQTYIKGPALIEGVVNNTGVVVLNNTSQTVQTFIGGPYNVTLPSALTLPLGKYYYFINLSGSGNLFVRDFGANVLKTIPGGYQTYCVLYGVGTANGAWNCSEIQINLANSNLVTGTLPISNGGTGQIAFAAGVITSNGTSLTSTSVIPIANGGTSANNAATAFNNLSPMTAFGDIIYGAASGAGTRLAAGTSGGLLQTLGAGLAPVWISIRSIIGNLYSNATTAVKVEYLTFDNGSGSPCNSSPCSVSFNSSVWYSVETRKKGGRPNEYVP